jgi:tripartite-type tricarboxylate transporter receptor subunit TctC
MLSTSASGAAYPEKPIRLVVAYPAGGNADFIARTVAQELSDRVGQQVVVDNRGGAGGIIGSSIVAKADPDGYTLLYVSISHAVNPSLHKHLPYDTIRDFSPISLVASVPNILVVHPSVPVKSVSDLIAYAKAHPGKLNYAASLGTSLHIAGELFKATAHVDIVPVFYRSGGVAVTDLLADRAQMSFLAMSTGLTMARAGKLRALAVTSAKRSRLAPELPTVGESLPGYAFTGWAGVLAPAGTPKAIVTKLNKEIVAGVESREAEKRLLSRGVEPETSTPEAFRKFVVSEVKRVSELMARAGIEPN